VGARHFLKEIKKVFEKYSKFESLNNSPPSKKEI
jgi:hypothetical protein